MGDKFKIGTRIDPELWEEFRAYVEQKHGSTHTHLGKELENAIRTYLEHESADDDSDVDVSAEALREIIEKLETLNAKEDILIRQYDSLQDQFDDSDGDSHRIEA